MAVTSIANLFTADDLATHAQTAVLLAKRQTSPRLKAHLLYAAWVLAVRAALEAEAEERVQ